MFLKSIDYTFRVKLRPKVCVRRANAPVT